MTVTAVVSPAADRRRARQCGSKVRYLSRVLAENAATLHAWAGMEGMTAYRCRWCGDWHIGHRHRRRR